MADTKEAMSAVAQAGENAREYFGHAGEQFREGCSQVAGRAREGYRRAGDVVRHNPARSVTSVFGVGLVVGVVVGLALSLRSR
jgi:ElaB/YqjD/DUF883 family membrane-anchored ribosome-binding protein